jgi:hypothetical protein
MKRLRFPVPSIVVRMQVLTGRTDRFMTRIVAAQVNRVTGHVSTGRAPQPVRRRFLVTIGDSR